MSRAGHSVASPEFDYNDDRVLSTAKLREQVEEFFTTMMA